MAKKPRQTEFSSMEDRAIKELEDAAASYAELRDERTALTEREVELKERLIGIMERHKKTEYVRNGISIKIVPKSAKVKVRIKSPKEEVGEN